MIVSHEHKFIFLKTKKTASTSIELALSALCGDGDVITLLTEIDEALRANGRGAGPERVQKIRSLREAGRTVPENASS
jgi:hypothetical protein